MTLRFKNSPFKIKSLVYFLATCISLSFFSCKNDPDFPETPVIEFDTAFVDVEIDPDILQEVNYVNVHIKFQDGDGDLGEDMESATDDKYQDFSRLEVGADGDTVYNFINYYLSVFRKVGDDYEEIATSIDFNKRFDPLIDKDELGPIEGVLEHQFFLSQSSVITGVFNENDTVRMEVYVVDRSLNVSNTIVTDDIILFKN